MMLNLQKEYQMIMFIFMMISRCIGDIYAKKDAEIKRSKEVVFMFMWDLTYEDLPLL